MSKSSIPDTRNKLETMKIPSEKKKKITKKSLKEFKSLGKAMSDVTFKAKTEKKKTKGQLFKEVHGFSKSVVRAMRKAGIADINDSASLNTYRQVRKKRKK